MHSIKLTGRNVPKTLKGSYRGRKFHMEVTTNVTLPSDANLWSGGSRDRYYAVRLADGAEITLGSTDAPWDPDRKEKTVLIPKDIVVVRHTMFQGTDMGLYFYVHPDNVAYLPLKNG